MSKKTTALLNIVLLSSLGLGVSCSKSEKAKNSQISTRMAAQLASEGKSEAAAEMYSRIGEILLSKPEGIVHAQMMFQKSLELNANDNKAIIYSSVISPLLTTKGYITRFSKLSELNANNDQSTKLEAEVRATGVKEFIDFALVMPEDAKAAQNVEDVRKFIRTEFVKELGNSLVKLDNIKSDRFTLNLDVTAYSGNRSPVTYCFVMQNGEMECQEVSANIKNANVTIDSYDVGALKTLIKTQKNALMIATSFGLDGYKKVADRFKNGTIKTDKAVVEALKSQPNFLKIVGAKDDLREIFDHTEEVMNDMIDFSKISKTVCNSVERKSNLFNNICVTEASAENMSETLMFVLGPKSVVLGHDINGREVTVEINLRGLMDSKVASLQELLPTKFDASGRALEVKDLTFAGIIPNGDLIEKLKTVVSR